ncbi:Patellin-5 [Gracilariopsis chorda]|uniref:Patellin-5 n=1 Tax=Gracilariopsis chorda TaxID=448386 RepID=A0A2V3IXM9_9FLOR|nr:Patellin-5 [Gracilariopsis chorda]|eukprot:PXF46871.1 Patellin-5 [Gracilariopsis chorda]
MRRYIPFNSAAHSHSSDSATSPPPSPKSPSDDTPPPPSSCSRPHIPHVPLPHVPLPHVPLPHVPHVSVPHVSVRKLFHANSSSHALQPDAQQESTPLTALSALIDEAIGPLGAPHSKYATSMAHDRLFAELHDSVQSRIRLETQFLRARQGNPQEAMTMITTTLTWRLKTNINHYLAHSAANMIHPDACFPMHIISNPDTCKQPVAYGLIRLLDKKKVDKLQFQNAMFSFLESIYFAHTYILDDMVIFLDFRDWSIRRNTPYRIVKDAIQTLQEYYPDRLGRVFLLNYPTTIRAAYTAISPIIDTGAKEKIVWIADDDPSATLGKYIPPKSIPTFLGGELEAVFPHNWPDVASEFGKTR